MFSWCVSFAAVTLCHGSFSNFHSSADEMHYVVLNSDGKAFIGIVDQGERYPVNCFDNTGLTITDVGAWEDGMSCCFCLLVN